MRAERTWWRLTAQRRAEATVMKSIGGNWRQNAHIDKRENQSYISAKWKHSGFALDPSVNALGFIALRFDT